jgi:hypothetical protein
MNKQAKERNEDYHRCKSSENSARTMGEAHDDQDSTGKEKAEIAGEHVTIQEKDIQVRAIDPREIQ